MDITVKFKTQIRDAAGTESIRIGLQDNARFNELIEAIGNISVNKLNDMLFSPDHKISRTLLLTLNNTHHIREGDNILLHDGDVITIISPISGG